MALQSITCICILIVLANIVSAQLQDQDPPTQLLINAASDNNTKDALALLKRGVAPNPVTVDGVTPLHYACWNGNVDIVHAIITASPGKRPFQQDKKGAAPLHTAAIAGHAKIVGILLQAGHKLHLIDENGMMALHMAARAGALDVVKLLITAGGRLKVPDRLGWTPLAHAAASNSVDVVNEILNSEGSGGRRALLEFVDEQGLTPLCLAAYHNSVDVLRTLIAAGALITPPSAEKVDLFPLHLAAAKGHVKVIQELYRAQSSVLDIVDKNGRDSIHIAAQNGQNDALRTLLAIYNNTNRELKADKHGLTPLHTAAFSGNLDGVVLVLVLGHVEPDAQDEKGMTALHGACYRNHTEVVKILLGAGANPDIQDNDGRTPLHVACETDESTYYVAEALLEVGAHPNVLDANGFFPYQICLTNPTNAAAALLVPMFRRVDRKMWTAEMVKEWLWYLGLDDTVVAGLQDKIDVEGRHLFDKSESFWRDLGVGEKDVQRIMEGIGREEPILEFDKAKEEL